MRPGRKSDDWYQQLQSRSPHHHRPAEATVLFALENYVPQVQGSPVSQTSHYQTVMCFMTI